MRQPLQTIVHALGGDLYNGGYRANVPYPGHSPQDRSLSLLWDGDRVIVNCFGAGDWKEALDHLRGHGLVDGDYRPTGLGLRCSSASPRTKAGGPERIASAVSIWSGGRAVPGTLAAAHLRHRHIRRRAPGPETARYNSATPLSVYKPVGSSPLRTALVFAILDSLGTLRGVEVTYLNSSGRRADDLKLPRKHVGCVPAGCAVRLDPAAPEMLVAEGAFTALSASERFSLPAWALLSTRNLRVWVAPTGVRSVLIAGDNGMDGRRSARILAARLRDQRLTVRLAFPEGRFGDWNDVACG